MSFVADTNLIFEGAGNIGIEADVPGSVDNGVVEDALFVIAHFAEVKTIVMVWAEADD